MNMYKDKVAKLLSRLAAVLCVFAAILLGCKANVSMPIAVTGVTLNKSALTLEEGKSEQLKATVKPANATNKAVKWSSDKSVIASVDANGTVTAHKAGEATITVTTEGGTETASCTVTVTLTEYAITYHLNGGTNDSINPASYNAETLPIILEAAERTGCTFKGWYDNAACSGKKVKQIVKGSTGNKALWAKWEALTYSITYNLNGGSHSGNPANYTIETETIILQDASKASYTFAGWYDNAACSGSPVTHIGKGSTGNKTFWAKWEAVTYTITYHLNNGSNHADNPENYTIETEMITLKDASKANYTFAGWYDNAACSGSPVTHIGKGSTGNKTFWAKWEARSYTITYNLNGGTNNNGNPATYTVETETILLKAAERTGATFMGWYDNEGYTGSAVSEITKGSTGNKEFWAKWEVITYNIVYNLNGGSHSGNPVSYNVETETITLKDASKANDIFAGWYDNAECSGSPVTQIAKGSSGNKELYAKFIEMKMIDIAAITDGSIGDDSRSNNKVHTVSLTAYRIGETEVTQELWQAVMGTNPSFFDNTGNKILGSSTYDTSPASGEVQEKRPVEQVTWYDCIMFCNELTKKVPELGESQCVYTVEGHSYTKEDGKDRKIPEMDMSKKGFRLPTAAEWEWAAKGGTENKWAGTDEEDKLKDYAWYGTNSGDKTHEVKQKQANGYGLYDMSGNVWEWCWDWYTNSTPVGGQTDPTGAASGVYRVFRGGSWGNIRDGAARAVRFYSNPDDRIYSLGLRVVSRP